jgi:hypothetical protein
MSRLGICGGAVAWVLLSVSATDAQVTPLSERVFSEQVLRPIGQPVVPIYEGYYQNPDGTHEICFGYFNLNTQDDFDVPLGPSNFIEPAEFDGAQPTHFDRVPAGNYRRHLCVFTVHVPADFGDREVVWTLDAGVEALSSPGKVLPSYILDEVRAPGRENVAPILRFERNGTEFQGRSGFTGEPRTVSVGDPLTLTVWIDHPDDRVWLGWAHHQGPGRVNFSQSEIQAERADGMGSTTARFNEPGDYLIRVQAIDRTAEFEFHCCWTNGYIPVRVVE